MKIENNSDDTLPLEKTLIVVTVNYNQKLFAQISWVDIFHTSRHISIEMKNRTYSKSYADEKSWSEWHQDREIEKLAPKIKNASGCNEKSNGN